MVIFIAQTQVYICERLSHSLNFHIDKNKSSKITVFAFLISIYLFEMRSDFRNLTCNTLTKLNLDKKLAYFDFASGANFIF